MRTPTGGVALCRAGPRSYWGGGNDRLARNHDMGTLAKHYPEIYAWLERTRLRAWPKQSQRPVVGAKIIQTPPSAGHTIQISRGNARQRGESKMRRMDYAAGECADNLTALAARANAEHHAVERAAREQVQHAVAAGRALLAIKQIVGHGAFMPWVAHHFTGSARTARLYMWLAAQPEAKWQRAATLSLRTAIKEIRQWDTLMGNGGGCEYYTPTLILDLSIRVMGGLDLDPAWHPDCAVKAKRTYTAKQNGLAQEW